MKRLLQRFSQIVLQTIRALAGYGDLVLAWLNGIAAHLFPTPIKVQPAPFAFPLPPVKTKSKRPTGIN